MILVLGATGTTGGEVARQLIAAGHTPRLLVRTPDKAAAFRSSADIVQGDLDHPESLRAAMTGVEKVYLAASGVNGQTLEVNAIDAAKATGVRHIVKLSVITAESPKFSFAHWHAAAEQHLVASGLAWTMLRPANFMTNALGWAATIKSQGAFYQPTGDGRWAAIDPADIGAVAVKALTEPGHEGKAYTLTGPESLDAAGYAAVLSKVLGKAVSFVDVPPAAAQDGMLKSGMPAAYVTALLDLLAFMKTGGLAATNDVVTQVLGRTPATFESWVTRNIQAFR